MRWSIIRLIWFRELRDQLRDRRTVFMIAVLPLLLYPLGGLAFLQVYATSQTQPAPVGVVGLDALRPWRTAEHNPFPAPLADRDWGLSFAPRYTPDGRKARLVELAAQAPGDLPDGIDRSRLDNREVDALLAVPPDFQRRLEAGEQPTVYVLKRDNDEMSRAVAVRVGAALTRWKDDVKRVHFARRGLPSDFDVPVRVIHHPPAPAGRPTAETAFALLVRIFPFILVMWALAGAMYPAVDVCAGEKERGTMETLLISPAGREEIVWGKFLTIWVFSTATALLNLLGMGITAWQFGSALPSGTLRASALVWAVVLLLPLSAFFSAVCLAVGAYARSSKEGQYYLMPLFVVTMPLIFLTLAPGVELNAFWSMVPVTGVALLLQRLMLDAPGDRGVWLYFVPVLAPMVIYCLLALRWAIAQFRSEEVLFREAERLDLGLWLRRLLREKEPLPTAGEAIFCFALILGLRWLSFGVGTGLPLWVRTGVMQLAFVLTPAVFMAVMLTTRPIRGLALRPPPLWAVLLAPLLAVALLPPLAELTLTILRQFPALEELLKQNHPLTRELLAGAGGRSASAVQLFVVMALLPALCEELAFRGFILRGLLRGFRPWTAILLSSFLFAAYQMNVFQFLPHFLFGVVLGVLVYRSGSVWPAVLFHLIHNTLLMGRLLAPGAYESASAAVGEPGWGRAVVSAVCLLVAAGGLYTVWRLGERTALHGDEA